jgi:hypothetical protein
LHLDLEPAGLRNAKHDAMPQPQGRTLRDPELSVDQEIALRSERDIPEEDRPCRCDADRAHRRGIVDDFDALLRTGEEREDPETERAHRGGTLLPARSLPACAQKAWPASK